MFFIRVNSYLISEVILKKSKILSFFCVLTGLVSLSGVLQANPPGSLSRPAAPVMVRPSSAVPLPQVNPVRQMGYGPTGDSVGVPVSQGYEAVQPDAMRGQLDLDPQAQAATVGWGLMWTTAAAAPAAYAQQQAMGQGQVVAPYISGGQNPQLLMPLGGAGFSGIRMNAPNAPAYGTYANYQGYYAPTGWTQGAGAQAAGYDPTGQYAPLMALGGAGFSGVRMNAPNAPAYGTYANNQGYYAPAGWVPGSNIPMGQSPANYSYVDMGQMYGGQYHMVY